MPTLRERIGTMFGKRLAIPAIEFHAPYAQWHGPGIGNQPSVEKLLQENIGVPDTATRAIANRIGTLNPLVKMTRRVTGGTEEEEILDDHVLKELLDNPHPDFSRFQMQRLLAQYIVAAGEAYLLKVRNGLAMPAELHPIPPKFVETLWSQGVISGYRVTTGAGAELILRREAVVRFSLPDPENPWTSEGYLGPTAIAADSLKFAGQHLRSHYQNDGTPKSVLEAGETATPFDQPSKEKFYAEWRRRYHRRWGEDSGMPGILPTGYTLKELAASSGENIVPLLEFWRDETLMAFGVPRSVLGQVVSGDRSSAETNQFVFDLHTVLPIATLISDALTVQLAHDYAPELFVEFDKFVSDDKRFRLEEETADLAGKVRSVNQVREDRGLDPVEWGDAPVGQIGQMPYSGDDYSVGLDMPSALQDDEPDESQASNVDESQAITGSLVLNGAQVASIVEVIQNVGDGLIDKASAAALLGVAFGIDEPTAIKIIGEPRPQPTPEPEPESEEDEGARRHGRLTTPKSKANGGGPGAFRALSFFAPEAEWERQIAREKTWVPAFERALFGILSQQKRSVLKKLEAATPRARVSADDLFAPDEWRELFEQRTEPIREKAFIAVYAETLAAFGIDEFVFTDAQRAMLEQQGAALIKNTLATTRKLIQQQLVKATAAGEGVDQIAKRIRSVFRVRRKHARTIARTEILKASQTAQLEGFETSGVVERKRWNTSLDAAVRDSHIYAQGQVVGLEEPFDLAGEPADAPGVGFQGRTLSAGNSINCRCFVTPVIGE